MKFWAYHQYSTWMIVASFIIMAALVHPSLISYILVSINVGLMVLTREVARWEGSYKHPCWGCAICAGVAIIIAFFVMLKINWLAI